MIVEAEKLHVGDLIILPNESKFLVTSMRRCTLRCKRGPNRIGLVINCLRILDNVKIHFEWHISKEISILRG